MNTRKTTLRHWGHFALTPLALAMAWAGAAHGAEYWLCAKSTSVIMPGDAGNPNNVSVPMWGYALDTTGFAGNCAAPASVPGPELFVPVAEGLTVHLRNVDLPEPTSIVIPGQATTMSPVRHTAGPYAGRVRSFAAEATAGTDQTYSWATLKPGTYLYHSGTHPQVQVQMGLYGAAKHDEATGLAYAGVPYASEVTLLFSEIDPALHTAVAQGQYGPNLPVSSTIDYAPQYFLINGKPHTDASLPAAAGSAGQATLLRLLNAGLQTRSPVLQGMHMRLVAEDGKPYPHAREQYSVFLPALKTVDAVITPASAGTYPIYDRRLAVTSPGPSGSVAGGMLAKLEVASAAAGTPVAVADSYSTNEDTPLSGVSSVLANDSGTEPLTAALVAGPTHSTAFNLSADGSFTYTPQPNYNGADSFSYRVMSGGAGSVPATVSLNINPVNDVPLAANNTYSVAAGATLNVTAPGVLANDSDVDLDALSAVLVGGSGPAAGTLTFNSNGSFSYVAPAAAGTQSFTYQANDGTAASTAATVSITVLDNRAPVAVDDTVSTPRNAALTINVLTNDTDPDGNLYPATVTIVTPPNKGGTATVVGNGTNSVTVSYTPKLNFRGTENFTYQVSDSLGATLYTSTKSTTDSRAVVRVNVK